MMRKYFVTAFLLFALASIFLVRREAGERVFSCFVLFGFVAGFIAMYRVLMHRAVHVAFGVALGFAAVIVGLVVFNAQAESSPIVAALAYGLARFGQAAAIPIGIVLGLFAGLGLGAMARILEQEEILRAQELSK
jgi:hypothetical protein